MNVPLLVMLVSGKGQHHLMKSDPSHVRGAGTGSSHSVRRRPPSVIDTLLEQFAGVRGLRPELWRSLLRKLSLLRVCMRENEPVLFLSRFSQFFPILSSFNAIKQTHLCVINHCTSAF